MQQIVAQNQLDGHRYPSGLEPAQDDPGRPDSWIVQIVQLADTSGQTQMLEPCGSFFSYFPFYDGAVTSHLYYYFSVYLYLFLE